MYIVETVGRYVCSLIAREGTNRFAPNMGCLFLVIGKRAQKGQNSGNVLSSIPGKGGSCSSENKHDRGTAPICFEQMTTETNATIPKKLFWVRVPMKISVPQKLSMIEQRSDQSCLFRRGDYRNKGHNPEKLFWVRVPVKIVSVPRKLSTKEERRTE
jgi:hypothetical protein